MTANNTIHTEHKVMNAQEVEASLLGKRQTPDDFAAMEKLIAGCALKRQKVDSNLAVANSTKNADVAQEQEDLDDVSEDGDDDNSADVEGRRQRRLMQNRKSARKCRMKKKEEFSVIKDEVVSLRSENKQLKDKVNEITVMLYSKIQEVSLLQRKIELLQTQGPQATQQPQQLSNLMALVQNGAMAPQSPPLLGSQHAAQAHTAGNFVLPSSYQSSISPQLGTSKILQGLTNSLSAVGNVSNPELLRSSLVSRAPSHSNSGQGILNVLNSLLRRNSNVSLSHSSKASSNDGSFEHNKSPLLTGHLRPVPIAMPKPQPLTDKKPVDKSLNM